MLRDQVAGPWKARTYVSQTVAEVRNDDLAPQHTKAARVHHEIGWTTIGLAHRHRLSLELDRKWARLQAMMLLPDVSSNRICFVRYKNEIHQKLGLSKMSAIHSRFHDHYQNSDCISARLSANRIERVVETRRVSILLSKI